MKLFSKNSLLLGLLAVLLVVLDQWVKYITRAKLANGSKVILKNIFELTYVENRGAAFGVLQGQKFVFLLLTVLFTIVFIYILIKMPGTMRFLPARISIIILLAGTIGNAIDRVYFGFVTDTFYFKLIDFPVFNVADCYITISVVLIAVLVLFVYDDDEVNFIGRKNS